MSSSDNLINGNVHGQVVQARTISGPVTVNVSPTSALTEPADQLAQAVGTRCRREEEQRQVQDPFPLPVRWRRAPEDLTDHWENICGATAGATASPLALTGELGQVVDVYRKIPSGRLVVLGREGSGKTILTLRFVLDLLKTRASTDVVPVIFSIGSWNPATQLEDWLIGQLMRDYPGLAATGPDGSTLAAELVEARRILPVLDGFDEIADGLHRVALHALNTTSLPLVLTSRPTEYATAVTGTDVLSSAAVIELTDLTLADLANYLPRTTRKATANGSRTTTAWDPVLDELRDHPQSLASANLAAVLTTPLMVALARTIYSDTPDHNPLMLLDTDRFRTTEALEEHLLANFVPTVYRHQPRNHRRWDPGRVEYWLGYLARHLDRLATRDLAWWQLGNTVSRRSRMIVVGLVTGLVIALVDWFVGGLVRWLVIERGLVPGLTGEFSYGIASALLAGLLAGLLFGLGHGFMATFRSTAFEPSRVRVQIFGGTRTTRARFVPRFVAGLLGGLAFGLLFGLVAGTGTVSKPVARFVSGGLVDVLMWGLACALVFGLAAGLVFGATVWFEALLDIRSAVSPADLLNTNRTAVILQLLLFGPVFGLIVALGGGLICGVLQELVSTLVFGFVDGLMWGFVSGLGGGLGLVLSMTAWGQWIVLSRVWLPLTGQLPWAMRSFLDDAYQQGVLRQVGAVYQFRHARLQDHLGRSHRIVPVDAVARRAEDGVPVGCGETRGCGDEPEGVTTGGRARRRA